MSSLVKYDVVIVGAGPAGSSAAMILADKGFKVAIFEKEKLPRPKPCGGGVSKYCKDSLKRLNIDMNKVTQQEYRGYMVSYNDLSARWDAEEVVGWGVYREDFDYAITKNAINTGATLFNERVKGFKEKNGIIKVATDSGQIETSVLFGADGVNSIVRKNLGIPFDRDKLGFCYVSEVKANKKTIDSYDVFLNLDFSHLKNGYIWVFPKADGKTLNVGLGTYLVAMRNSNVDFKELLIKFVKDRKISDRLDNIHGAMIPFGGTVDCFGKNNVLLLGDAAGLVSPLDGEGLPYALKSGIIAAESAIKFFEKEEPLVESYKKDISPLAEEINVHGLRLQRRLYGNNIHRRLIVELCVDNPSLLEIIGKIILHTIPHNEAVQKLSAAISHVPKTTFKKKPILESVYNYTLSDNLNYFIDEYEHLFGKRNRFLWKWLGVIFKESGVTLSTVDREYLDSTVDNKILITIITVVLDDIAEYYKDGELLGMILEMWNHGTKLIGGYKENEKVMFVKKLWDHLMKELSKYPRYEEFKNIFIYDFNQMLNTIRYSYLTNLNPEIINLQEAEIYGCHNMIVYLYNGIDLMASPDFDKGDLPRLRTVFWYAQQMARAGNWLSTWKRELSEKDFSSGVFGYAASKDNLNISDIEKIGRDEVISKIESSDVYEYLIDSWEHNYEKIKKLKNTIKSIDMDAYTNGLENVLKFHLATEGLK